MVASPGFRPSDTARVDTPTPTYASFVDGLRQVYKDAKENFEAEDSILADLVPKLIKDLEGAKYVLKEPKFLGSTATIWLVVDPQLGRTRALKLPRPRKGKIRRIITTIQAERKRLSSLSHQNLATVYFASDIKNEVDGEEYTFPYFIMDYFEGVKDLDKFIIQNRRDLTGQQIIEAFYGILNGLRYLHEKQIVHCDIKPGNLLAAPMMPPLVSDLGYAKDLLELSDTADIEVIFTEKYAHPELLAKRAVKYTSDPHACRAVLKRAAIKPQFDLFALGRSLQEILAALYKDESEDRGLKTQSGRHSIFTEYQWTYLDLIAKRLLNGVVDRHDSDRIDGMPSEVMLELRYESAAEAIQDVDKLLNLYDLEGQIPELNPSIPTYIQVPRCKVPLTDRVRAVVNHEGFRRLSQISQLGFVSLVYPGANHTRFEHALGTFASCCAYVRALWYDDTSCLFRSIMSERELELVLLAALLHDVGQYPMAHDLAEASESFEHEIFTREMLERIPPDSGESLRDVIESVLWNVNIDDLLRVIHGGPSAGFKHRILHSIINGPLDCDKVDYLGRDAIHLGVPFGSAVDDERLLRNLTIVYEGNPKRPREYLAEVAVTEKARTIAQSIWRVRHDMFTQVYWQHTVRSMKAMLAFVLRRVLVKTLASDSKEAETGDLFDFFHELICGNYGSVWSLVAEKEGEASPLTQDDVVNEISIGSVTRGLEPEKFNGFASGLCVSDDALLALLWCFADSVGKRVIHAIRTRNLYRRVAVLSSARDKNHYQQIYGPFRTDADRGDLQKIESMREQCEERILLAFQRKLAAVPELLPPGVTLNDILSDIDSVKPLVLIDVPIKAAARESFRYAPEDVLPKFTQLREIPRLKQTSSAEERVSLGGERFDIDVGKIRVFVHPDWSYYLSACLTDEEIMNCVQPFQSEPSQNADEHKTVG